MSIDINTRRPRLGNIFGGLSGPAIKPLAVRMVYEVARAVNTPIIGIGGIASLEDALEFFLVGATAVQVGTANFNNPKIAVELVDALDNYLDTQQTTLSDLVGGVVIPNSP
jgi:dihydroorotate dehydrogenase (NAD+) catalytic subunit